LACGLPGYRNARAASHPSLRSDHATPKLIYPAGHDVGGDGGGRNGSPGGDPRPLQITSPPLFSATRVAPRRRASRSHPRPRAATHCNWPAVRQIAPGFFFQRACRRRPAGGHRSPSAGRSPSTAEAEPVCACCRSRNWQGDAVDQTACRRRPPAPDDLILTGSSARIRPWEMRALNLPPPRYCAFQSRRGPSAGQLFRKTGLSATPVRSGPRHCGPIAAAWALRRGRGSASPASAGTVPAACRSLGSSSYLLHSFRSAGKRAAQRGRSGAHVRQGR
jgi:hypothetical protein